jgi:hypothetical protein
MGVIKLFPARESFVNDIPAGDRKISNLFITVKGQKIPFGNSG